MMPKYAQRWKRATYFFGQRHQRGFRSSILLFLGMTHHDTTKEKLDELGIGVYWVPSPSSIYRTNQFIGILDAKKLELVGQIIHGCIHRSA